jgi:hypothetical protein
MLKVNYIGAHVAEHIGGQQLLEPLRAQFTELQIIWADQGYTGNLGNWMHSDLGWRLEIVKRTSVTRQKELTWETTYNSTA